MKRWLFLALAVVAFLVFYFFVYSDAGKPKTPDINSTLKETQVVDARKAAIASNRKQKSTDQLNYETASDLSLIADHIRSKADSGDPTAQRIYGQMLEECWKYSLTKKTFKADLDGMSKMFPELGDLYARFGTKVEKRCGNFTKNMPISIKDPYMWYGLAALKKDAQATAKILTHMGADKLNDQALKEGVDFIIASKDPDALMELANIMGAHNQTRASALGPLSGSQRNEYAWRLAACRLGADCGADAQVVMNFCLNGGARSACTGNSLQEAIRRDVLAPSEYDAALRTSTEIINSLPKP